MILKCSLPNSLVLSKRVGYTNSSFFTFLQPSPNSDSFTLFLVLVPHLACLSLFVTLQFFLSLLWLVARSYHIYQNLFLLNHLSYYNFLTWEHATIPSSSFFFNCLRSFESSTDTLHTIVSWLNFGLPILLLARSLATSHSHAHPR